jgi:hypothetical protein
MTKCWQEAWISLALEMIVKLVLRKKRTLNDFGSMPQVYAQIWEDLQTTNIDAARVSGNDAYVHFKDAFGGVLLPLVLARLHGGNPNITASMAMGPCVLGARCTQEKGLRFWRLSLSNFMFKHHLLTKLTTREECFVASCQVN